MTISSNKKQKRKSSPEIRFGLAIMAVLVSLALLSVLSGCRTRPPALPPASSQSTNTIIERDTVYVPGEQRQAVYGAIRSRLETDYSVSEASIDTLGKMVHSIWNKPTVPARVIIQRENTTDSIAYPVKGDPYPVKGDTVYVLIRDWFWQVCFGISLFTVTLFIGWIILKVRKAKSFFNK